MLDDTINDILEQLDVDLTTLITKCKLFEKPYEYDSIEKKRELRILIKERRNETKRLKQEAENNKDELLNDLLEGENEIFKLLTDLKYEKHSALNYIAVLESKLIKLEISPERIDRIKNSVLSFNLCHCKSKLNLKQYFNNKSLIVYVNHVLLGFLFMSVQNT